MKMHRMFLAHRQLFKKYSCKRLKHKHCRTNSWGGSVVTERSWPFLKHKKQLVEVGETEGLDVICFSLIEVNVGQSD